MLLLLVIIAISISLQHRRSNDLYSLMVNSHPVYSLLSHIVATSVNIYRLYFMTAGSLSVPDIFTFKEQIKSISDSIDASQSQTEALISLPWVLESLSLPKPPSDSLTTGRLLVSGVTSQYEQSVAAAIDEFFNVMRVFSFLSSPDSRLTERFSNSNSLNRALFFSVNNTLTNYRNTLVDMDLFLTKQVQAGLKFSNYSEYIIMPVVILVTTMFLLVKTSRILSVQKRVIEIISLLKDDELLKLIRNCKLFLSQLEDDQRADDSPPKNKSSNPYSNGVKAKSSSPNTNLELDLLASTERKQLLTLRTNEVKNGFVTEKASLRDIDQQQQLKESPINSSPRKQGKRGTVVVKENIKAEKEKIPIEDPKEDIEINIALAQQSKTTSRKIYLSFVWRVLLIVVIIIGVICGKLLLELNQYSQARRTLEVMSNLFRVKANLKTAECVLYTEAYNRSIGELFSCRSVE